ncbi:hypothetical protein ATO13_22251 [Stappia sp. 22II-S9-Z10]|nr:hypothetical protein ATO13_22251 [Stappia sp. 22II-S9-Z10]
MRDWDNDEGGAAFPIAHSDAPGAPCAEHGMSLRDWFAGQALVGFLAAGPECWHDVGEVARGAYETADAMIRARSTPKTGDHEAAAVILRHKGDL